MPAHFKIEDFLFTKGKRGGATFEQVIKAAMPDADRDMIHYVLWERTPFPFVKLTARSLFKSTDRIRRTSSNGNRLCEFCDRLVPGGKWTCEQCTTDMGNEYDR